jgi:hypothetical protein
MQRIAKLALLTLSLTLIALFNLVPSAVAATRYVSQSGGTFTGGSRCNAQTAISVATFNGTTNSAGDVNILCGTLTTTLTPLGNGSAGNVISIIFDTGASISLPSCGANGCIFMSGLNYYLIDGSPTATPCGYVNHVDVACSGTIEATATGTGMGQTESMGIYARGASHIEIRNLMIRNMYQHTSTSDQGAGHNYYGVWYGAPNSDTVNVHNITCHDMKGCVVGETPNTNNTIAYSELYRMNWGTFQSGGHTVNGISNFSFHDNDVHDMENWDDTTDSFHHDGIMLASDDTGNQTVNGAEVYNNYFHGGASSPTCSGGNPCVTAWIFMEGVYNIHLYNNVIVANSGEEAANGWIFFWSPVSSPNDTGQIIANNTVLGSNLSNGACVRIEGVNTVIQENNILAGCAYLTWMDSNTTWTVLNNQVYQSSSLQWRNNNTTYSTLAAWRTGSGGDANAVATTGSLGLSAGYVPQAGSIAIGAGANLTSLCSGTVTALCQDAAGIARPASGAWDSGAYQFSGTTPPPKPPVMRQPVIF